MSEKFDKFRYPHSVQMFLVNLCAKMYKFLNSDFYNVSFSVFTYPFSKIADTLRLTVQPQYRTLLA